MEVSGQRHAPAALLPRKTPGTQFIAENLSSTGIQSPGVHPLASRYTDWANVAHSARYM